MSTSSFIPKITRTASHPKVMDDIVNLLKQKGHVCPQIIGMENHKFQWCEKDICPETLKLNDMKKRQNEQNKKYADLVDKGHTCMQILETYPMQILWCKQDICTG